MFHEVLTCKQRCVAATADIQLARAVVHGVGVAAHFSTRRHLVHIDVVLPISTTVVIFYSVIELGLQDLA